MGLLLSLLSGLAPAQPAPAPPIPAPSVSASLRLKRVEGAVQIEGHARYTIPAAPTLRLDAPGYAQLDVTGPPGLQWRYDGEAVSLDLSKISGDEITFTVDYVTRPTEGVIHNERGIWTAFSTWRWLPVRQDPSWRLTAQLDVQGPDGWVSLATGDGPGRPGPDIAARVPHPAYTLGFVSAQLAPEIRRGRLSVWGLSPAQAETALEHTARAHRRLLDRFGPAWRLPDGYVQVFVPGRAMQELAGMAFLSGDYVDALDADPNEDWLIVHELTHQLWGNRVTCATWGDFWLNEAIVTWWVGRDKQLRGDLEGHRREQALWRKRAERALAAGRDPRIQRPGVTVSEAGGAVVYNAGALLIEQLAQAIGVEVFEARLAGWMRQSLDAGVSLDTEALIRSLGLDPAKYRPQLQDARRL